jgi:hypothetical protein
MNPELNELVNNLNSVSKTFCLAKYDQFSLYLHLESTHSCHLSSVKVLKNEEIDRPFSFFNFKEIKKIRKEMKEGNQVKDCSYCWRIENNTKLNSERHIKSGYLRERFEEIKNMNPEDDIVPSYLEVSFSNLCNFKCSYCNINFSSRWKNDLLKHGDFRVASSYPKELFSNQLVSHYRGDPAGLVEKFFLYFPDILKNLKTLRVTGGEPTIQNELYRILDFIDDNPQPQLELSINSNLGANKTIIRKFINKLKSLENKVKKINIFTSCDSYGADAEFIREGLKYEHWKSNCYDILNEVNNANVNVMCTLNNLCITNNFKKFLKDVYDMTQYSIGRKWTRTYLNMEMLVTPPFMCVDILDYDLFENIINEIETLLESMEAQKDSEGNIISKGFSDVEIKRFHRIKKVIQTTDKPNRNELKKDLLSYLTQLGNRNDKKFLEIFNDDHYKEFFKRIFEDKKTRIGNSITILK